MIDMLTVLFPRESRRLRFSHDEFKSLDDGELRKFLRDRHLLKLVDTKTLRKILDRGEIWTLEHDSKLHVSHSFAGLMRSRGFDVPRMFDHVPPALPRHDAGLVLNYSSEVETPWQLLVFSESRTDKHQYRAMTLPLLLSAAFSFDMRRARINAEDSLDPKPYRPTQH